MIMMSAIINKNSTRKLFEFYFILSFLTEISLENLSKKLDLSDLYSVCQQCPFGSFDLNQCILPTDTNCIDATEPVKKLPYKSDTVKGIVSIKTSLNVFGEDILRTLKLKSNLPFPEINGRVSETFLRASRLLVNVTLLNVDLLPTFEDIQHKSDNEFILNSTQGSNLYHLKKPLLQVMKNYCRHPLPDSYFITMTTYNNRHTKAKRYKCDHEKHSSNNNCRLRSMETDSFYIRSVNEQCSKNKAMYLTQELNSFYCVENNKFINEIFQHQLRESISFHPDAICDFARRKCNTCINLKKKMCSKTHRSNESKTIDENCCSSKCLKNENCEKLYSPKCHYSDRILRGLDQDICMQGDTVKVTLNPQFHFKNNKFRCHIKKQKKKKTVKILIQFHIQDGYSAGKNWNSNLIVKEVPLFDPGNYTFGNISMYWSSKLNTQSEMILHGFQNPNQAEQFFSISKINREENLIPPKLQKHGDKSYIEVEFENIFQYSTSNWNSLSCRINISKIRSINRNLEQNQQNVIPISLVQKNENKPFVYVLKSAIEDPEIEIQIEENSSLLRLILCKESKENYPGYLVKDFQNESFSANLSLQKWPNHWNLLVEGFVSHDATFVNIRISDIATGVLLSDFEQIVFNQYNRFYNSFKSGSRNRNQSSVPIEFATYFHLDLHHLFSTQTKYIQIALLVEVQDCLFRYRKYIYHYPLNPSQLGTGNKQQSSQNHLPFQKKTESHINQISFQREMYHFLLQYLAIITFAFSIIYFFIIIALIIIRLCSKIDQKSLMHKIHSNYRKSFNQPYNQHVQSISTKRRMVLFLFVAFKVFYNFVFTLSVGLSLVLSLESNLTPFEITPSRFLFSIEQEVRKLDNYCSDELRRHNEFVNTMNKACQDKRRKCEMTMRNQLKTKYDNIIDPWIINKRQPIYKSISNILLAHYQQEFTTFYNYSQQVIEKQLNNQISQYYSYIDKFSEVLYLKTGIEFCKRSVGKSNQSFAYKPVFGDEIKSFNSQSIINLHEPLAIFNLYISFSNEYSKLENITNSLNQKIKPHENYFKEILLSKTRRYFQSTMKVHILRNKNTQLQPLKNEIDKYYKTQMKIISKSNRFQLKISLWQMRLLIVFIDIIIITYRFYHTLTTIKVIWFGSHIYLAVNNGGKNLNDKSDVDAGFQSFQYVKFKTFIRNNPTYEIAEFGLSINKIFPCFYCCKRLYYICIIIAFTLLLGVISIFVLSFYCIGRSHMNMPSSVADVTLQYMNQKVNSITTRHASRINTEKLKTSVLSDYKNRERLSWLQQFFQHEENQIQQNIHQQICTFSSTNNFFRSLKHFCRNNYPANSIHCSLQPCYFINVKSLNYTENKILKDMYTTGPLATSLILIPLLRFIAVAMLVVSAILIMLGIIYHSSKLLARLFLTFSHPINATILNRNFPLLSKSIMKQHFTHSTMPSVPDKIKPFNTLNRTLQNNPIFLKGLSNPFSSPVIARPTNSTNHSESRV